MRGWITTSPDGLLPRVGPLTLCMCNFSQTNTLPVHVHRVASFPDSTVIKSWGVESGNEAMHRVRHSIYLWVPVVAARGQDEAVACHLAISQHNCYIAAEVREQ